MTGAGSRPGSRWSTPTRGCGELVRRLDGVEGVAIERPDGPVIDGLLEAELRVVVIASRHVKALRTRHGLAGNKDDRSDAFVLADALRTDGHRLRPLHPDAPETVALRATVRARKDLVRHRVALVQQLTAHLALVFPGAVDLFADLASPIAQAFLLRFPSAGRAAWLGPKRLDHWLAAQGYSGRRTGEQLHARLEAAPRGMAGDAAEAMATVTVAYVRAIAADPGPARDRSMPASPSSWRSIPTAPSSRACPGRAGCAPRRCSPRSGTVGIASRHRSRWPASRAPVHRPASPGSTGR